MNNSILLVEDDDELREMVADGLGKAGYKVIQASNGRIALEILIKEQSPWFALITDFNMPHVNGGELVRRVRELGIKFEVTVMTSSVVGYEPAIARLRSEAPLSILEKPYSLWRLIQVLIHHKINKVVGY